MNKSLSVKEKAQLGLSKARQQGTMLGLNASSIADVISGMKSQIQQAVPKHLTADRVIQQATTLISRNPALAECTAGSLLGAVMQSSILGFQPVQALGQCYFVPFNNKGKKEIQFIIGYKGMIQLARNSNEIETIYAHPVYENDEFHYELGRDSKLIHKPAESDRGKVRCAYAIAKFKNGGDAFEVIFKDDVNKRKKMSAGGNSKYSAWNNWEEEMWVKTAIRKLFKWLPVSVDIQKAVQVDEATIDISNIKQGEVDIDEVKWEIDNPVKNNDNVEDVSESNEDFSDFCENENKEG